MAALTLGLAMLFMVTVVDSGRLYLEKRSLQRVADMSALEAATLKGNCASGNSASTFARQSATRNGFPPDVDDRTITVTCGTLSVNAADNRRTFVSNSTSTQAVQVVVSHPVQRSIAAGIASLFSGGPQSTTITLSATAVAAAAPPLAQLSIRSVAAEITSANSALLNLIFSNLLGGSLNLSAASWDGLINTNLNLLSYLDRLKLDLNLTALDYNQLLATNVTLNQLIQSTINLLQTNSTANTAVTILGLQALQASIGSATITLGDLVKVQSGTDISGLTTQLRLVDLLQTLAQVANKKNGIATSAQINLAPLATITTRIQVIEPPQLSAIGDPSKVNPSIPVLNDPNRIYVRTAQTRALISINLPILDTLLNGPPLSAVTDLVNNLTPVLNGALSLNLVKLVGGLSCLLASPCTVTDIKFLTSSSSTSQGPRIDLSLALAAAESYVTGYSCTSNTNKSLSVRTTATLLSARLGLIDSAAAFPASTDPAAVVALPLPIVDIGTKKCSILLGLLGTCSARTPYVGGGLGLSFGTLNNAIVGTAASTNSTFTSPNLPEIGQPPYYLNNVASVLPSTVLDGVVSGVQVQVYKPIVNNVLGNLISATGSLFNQVLALVNTEIIGKVVKPLLTSLVDPLLNSLGLTLNPADVGANLSCNIGQATLVI
ncbi:TadG family pilus assembly protein [Pseudomonas sp. 3A(2025)]